MWNILLFETPRGEKPVEKFIKSQKPQTIAKISHIIDLLEKYGPTLNLPHSKKLTSKLYELRIRGKQEIRIFYGFLNQGIYLLHAFRKQTIKTPQKKIETALKKFRLLT